MNKVFQFLLFTILSAPIQAQSYDSWKIFHNGRKEASFNNKKEAGDEKKVLLLNRNIEAPGYFIIEFTPVKETADWIRAFAFVDSSGKQVSEYPNVPSLRIANTELSSILEGKQKVKVYSWAIPEDPAVAATVRVRRILLCTLYTR
jgi:hypothetical protein